MLLGKRFHLATPPHTGATQRRSTYRASRRRRCAPEIGFRSLAFASRGE
jgi:hypothetical protein